MTMQVGMVGTDGILIASDTRWTNTPRLPANKSWFGARSGYDTTKMTISHERGIAVSSARSMETAGSVARKIIADLKDEDFRYPIYAVEQIGKSVLDAVDTPGRDNAQCLVGFRSPVPQLFLFQFGTINNEYGPTCQNIKTYAIAGDNLNSSIFWAEAYYQKVPVAKLVPLAAHLVVSAGALNSAMIRGLEMVIIDSTGIRRLSDDCINNLEIKCRERGNRWGELLLSDSHKLKYAPPEAL